MARLVRSHPSGSCHDGGDKEASRAQPSQARDPRTSSCNLHDLQERVTGKMQRVYVDPADRSWGAYVQRLRNFAFRGVTVDIHQVRTL